jgi:predicted DNA-binding transcriptional regulator AlpA
MLSAAEVARWVGISERSVWRWTKLGILPPPVRLGKRCSRWRASDIQRFLDARKEAGEGKL